jgi:kinesin family protein 16B
MASSDDSDPSDSSGSFLSLSIHGARGLPDIDHCGTCDAFVEVIYNGCKYWTDTVRRCSSPRWEFFQALKYSEDSNLELHVYAKGGGLLGDEYIGQVSVDRLDVTSTEAQQRLLQNVPILDGWYPIELGDGARRQGPGTTNPIIGRFWRRRTGATLPYDGVDLGELQLSVRFIDPEKFARTLNFQSAKVGSLLCDLTEANIVSNSYEKQIFEAKRLLSEVEAARAREEEDLEEAERMRLGEMVRLKAAAKLALAVDRYLSRLTSIELCRSVSKWRDVLTPVHSSPAGAQNDERRQPSVSPGRRDSILSTPSRIPGVRASTGGRTRSPPSRDRRLSSTSVTSPPHRASRQSLGSTYPGVRQSRSPAAHFVSAPSRSAIDLESELQVGRQLCWEHVSAHEDESLEADEVMSIMVTVRIRPTPEEHAGSRSQEVVSIQGTSQVVIKAVGGHQGAAGEHQFAFDQCFSGGAKQQDVFEGVGKYIIRCAWQGYNACLFAYGQTARSAFYLHCIFHSVQSYLPPHPPPQPFPFQCPCSSGKSHSMMGSEGDPGLIPRFCDHLFYIAQQAEHERPSYQYIVEVTCLQVYQEAIYDLLGHNAGSHGVGSGLRMRESPSAGVFIEGLTRVSVNNMQQMNAVIASAIESRAVGTTSLNQHSSRSHCIFTIIFTQRIPKAGAGTEADTFERQSHVNLIDLAGSERSKLAQTSGTSMSEGSKINQSLTTLGRVISTLAKGGGAHVPFRDSVLTMLLKESLGGNSRTMMLATVSPCQSNYDETLSTLRYANSAKRIKTRPVVNEDPTARMISDLQLEVARLRSELACARQEAPERGEEVGQLAAIEAHISEVSQLNWERRTSAAKMRKSSLVGVGGIDHDHAPFLLLMHADEMISGRLRYAIGMGETLVGRRVVPEHSRPDSSPFGRGLLEDVLERELMNGKAKLEFEGVGIRLRHCIFVRKMQENGQESLTVCPLQPGARVAVNGRTLTQPAPLRHGDRLVLGCCSVNFNFIDLRQSNVTVEEGHAFYMQRRIFNHEQIVREVGLGGSSEVESGPVAAGEGAILRRMQLLKNLRSLEDACMKARILASEANTIASDLEQGVVFKVLVTVPVPDAGGCSLQQLVENQQREMGVLVIASRSSTPLGSALMLLPTHHNQLVAQWSLEEFDRVVAKLADVYASLSELITRKEARGRGALLRDIFGSIAAGSKVDAIGADGLRDMLLACGMPASTEELKGIFEKYDEDHNGLLEVTEFERFALERMSAVFEECLFNQDLEPSSEIGEVTLAQGQEEDDEVDLLFASLDGAHQHEQSRKSTSPRKSIVGAAWASRRDRLSAIHAETGGGG